jgi:hypothetical protein
MDEQMVIPLRRLVLLLATIALPTAARAAAPAPPAAPAAGAAGTTAPDDKRALEARRACAAGRVEQGIELLAQIIAETGDPNGVYNQARCYQGNGRPEQALTRFREYLRIAGNLPPRDRERVRRFIVELEREVETRSRRRGDAALTLTAAGDPRPIGSGGTVTEGPPDGRPSSGSPALRAVALAAGAAAVVPLVGAVYFGRQAARIEGEIEQQARPVSPADFDRKWQKGKRAATLQWVGFGVAGGLLAAAGALYLLARPAVEAPPAQVGLLVAPGGGGALLTGRF